MQMYTFLLVLSLCHQHRLSAADEGMSLSVAGMVKLIESETKLIENLEHYGDTLEKNLNIVRGYVLELRLKNEKAKADPERVLSNPIESFSLLNRLENDWTYWELFIKKEVGKEFVDNIIKMRSELPIETDIIEAVGGIFRIQDTYGLKAEDIAMGNLNGIHYNLSLSSLDCYTIGYHLYDKKEYYPAALWIYSAITLFRPSDFYDFIGYKMVKIWQLYAEANARLEHLDVALKTIEIALNTDPTNAELILTKKDLASKIKARENLANPPRNTMIAKSVDRVKYEIGCRGEYPYNSKLHCLYNRTTSPFLLLAPLKMEEVYLDPYMVLYHDVIYDDEIAALQSLAKSSLIRAQVFDNQLKKSISQETRTSKLAWLHDTRNEVTVRINERIKDMTGFDLDGSEQLQVMNYGLGGHYDTHYDYFSTKPTDDIVKTNGNRIATVLFYLNNVEQGGSTVFPEIEKAVFPHKGTAVLWYNLNSRGDGDPRTLHAACPVIVGSKWVCNKWIREKQQIFRRRCI